MPPNTIPDTYTHATEGPCVHIGRVLLDTAYSVMVCMPSAAAPEGRKYVAFLIDSLDAINENHVRNAASALAAFECPYADAEGNLDWAKIPEGGMQAWQEQARQLEAECAAEIEPKLMEALSRAT